MPVHGCQRASASNLSSKMLLNAFQCYVQAHHPVISSDFTLGNLLLFIICILLDHLVVQFRVA